MKYRSGKRRSYATRRVPMGAIGSAVRMAVNAARVYRSYKGKGRSTERGITGQHDVRSIYRYKRMPYKKRKRWVRAVKRDTAMDMRKLSSTTSVFNSTLDITWADNDQRSLRAHLYGLNGDGDSPGEVGCNDVSRVAESDTRVDEQTEKMIFSSGVLDITMVNRGNVQLEVDVYKVINRGSKHGTSWGNDVNAAATVTTTTPSVTIPAPSDYGINTRGVTPFAFPYLSSIGKKIVRKTKYFLPVGNTATINLRDPKNRWMNGATIFKDSSYVASNVTQTLIFIAKAVAGEAAEATKRLVVGTTRTYVYKVLENNKTYNNLIVG